MVPEPKEPKKPQATCTNDNRTIYVKFTMMKTVLYSGMEGKNSGLFLNVGKKSTSEPFNKKWNNFNIPYTWSIITKHP